MDPVPVDVEQLLDRGIGRWRILGVRSHGRTGAPSVWEIEDLTGQRWFAKRHWNELPYQRETRAYDEFVPALGQRRAPWIADRDPDARLIVTRGLKGEPLSKVQLTGVQELEVFRQAGVLAARLHALTAVPAPGPVRSTPLRPQQRAKALDMAMDLGHGDFGPRNWIVHQRGELRLQLIDFERTTGGGAGAPRPDADRLPGHRAQARAGGGVLRRLRPPPHRGGGGCLPGVRGARLPVRAEVGRRPP